MQLRFSDPRVNELFDYLRKAVDVLEQIMLRPFSPQKTNQSSQIQPKETAAPAEAPPTPKKLAYRINEVTELVGLSRSAMYNAIRTKELRAVLPVIVTHRAVEARRNRRATLAPHRSGQGANLRRGERGANQERSPDTSPPRAERDAQWRCRRVRAGVAQPSRQAGGEPSEARHPPFRSHLCGCSSRWQPAPAAVADACDSDAEKQGPPEDCARTARALDDRDHYGYLQPRSRRHAGRRRRDRGRRFAGSLNRSPQGNWVAKR